MEDKSQQEYNILDLSNNILNCGPEKLNSKLVRLTDADKRMILSEVIIYSIISLARTQKFPKN